MTAKQGQELIVEGFHTTNTNFSLFIEVQHPQTEERMMKINKTSGCGGGKSKLGYPAWRTCPQTSSWLMYTTNLLRVG